MPIEDLGVGRIPLTTQMIPQADADHRDYSERLCPFTPIHLKDLLEQRMQFTHYFKGHFKLLVQS